MKNISFTIFFLILISSTAKLQQLPQITNKIAQAEKASFSNLFLSNILSVSSNNYDITHYRCEWAVDPAVRYIKGKVTTSFRITSATNNIVFDLSKALTVDSVLYRGNKIPFQHNTNNGLQVNFPTTLANNQRDSVSIFYQGVPPTSGFGSFTLTTHSSVPVMWTLSEPYGAREWWPCKDVLVDKADSIDIIITYPAAYRSSSNGLPVSEQTKGDQKIEHWKHTYPIATYLVAFAVTNYTVDNDAVTLPTRTMPVVMYAYPESAATFKTATNVAKTALVLLTTLVGEYPFIRERYAQTQFSWGGGMEHQTNSFMGSVGTGLVVHELAHQWFGNKVTTGSWQDLWLNEGFATYSEFLYVENFNLQNVLPHLKSLQNNITSKPDGSVFIPDTNNINRLFDYRLTYVKGAYLLHMLRGKLGDSVFFRGVRQYLNDPALAYSTARTADLQRNLEQVSGQNLTEFFKDWYLGEGYPNYSAEWSQQSNNNVTVKLNQTTSHPSVSFFEMPVQLQFKSGTRDTIVTVMHNQNGATFTLNPGFIADTLIIDPNLWILTKEKTSTKVEAVPVVPNDILVFPNPVQNNLSVSLSNFSAGTVNLHIANTLGQIVYRKTLQNLSDSERVDVPAANWPAGIYWLRVSADNNQILIKKILKLN